MRTLFHKPNEGETDFQAAPKPPRLPLNQGRKRSRSLNHTPGSAKGHQALVRPLAPEERTFWSLSVIVSQGSRVVARRPGRARGHSKTPSLIAWDVVHRWNQAGEPRVLTVTDPQSPHLYPHLKSQREYLGYRGP